MIFKYKGFSKYKAQKTIVDGIEFDSKWEAEKYIELSKLEKMGDIKDLQRQVPFILQDGFINNKGQKIRPIKYIADFVFFSIRKNSWIVMDTKSIATMTPEYKIKKKLFEAKYKEYIFIESLKK